MLKIFLVEDEYAVRERIKRHMDWELHGFSLVGEAGDGEMAYPMIIEAKPDLVITDIKMPFMDGLALSRLIKEKLPETKIIILSGYDEFEYAKEAINIGITEYLLKPISAKQLLEAITRIAHLVEKEKAQLAQYDQYRQTEKEQVEAEKRKFFYELLAYKRPIGELIERARQLGIELIAPAYEVILVKFILKDEGAFKESLEPAQKLSLMSQEAGDFVFLVKGTRLQLAEERERLLEKLKGLLAEGYQLYVGLGKEVARLSEVSFSHETANKALAYGYLLKGEPIVDFKTLEGHSMAKDSFQTIDVTKLDKKTIDNFLRSGLKEQVQAFTASYLEHLGQGIDSLLFRQYIMMDLYVSVATFIEQLGYKAEGVLNQGEDLKQITALIQTKPQTICYLEGLLEKAITLRDGISQKRYKALLEEAKNYIEKHYSDEAISLNQVAEKVNISPSHFSTIFSQELGQTFISYLTEVRMQKAKELLRCTSMKTLEIGYAVGYKDPHYFSYLFKKTQNCTPKAYRKANS